MNPEKNRHKSIEILIAEDSPTQAEQLRSLLEESGYTVVVAPDGKAALALAKRHKPTLIISDIMMPELDGYGLCRAIKSDERLKSVPVILLTALSDPQDVIKGLQCGADNFIRKPYDARYLLSRVNYTLMNFDMRKNQKMRMGLEISLGGERHFITSDREQILDLLISTYEQAVDINNELKLREKDLLHSHQILQGLYRIAEGLNEAVSEREVGERALARAMELPGVRAGWIQIPTDNLSQLRTIASVNLPPALTTPEAFHGSCVCWRKLMNGELNSVANIFECERIGRAKADTQGLRYHASVPLKIGDRALGVMNLAGPGEGLFDEEALKVLASVGNQVAVALERARLHEHLEKRVEERTEALRQTNVKLETEIERRRVAQERLQLAQESLAAVIDSSPVAVFAEDVGGKIVLWNPAAERIFGCARDEMLGRPRTEVLGQCPAELVNWVDRVRRGETARDVEVVHRRKDGKTVEFRLSMAPLHAPSGTTQGVLYIGDDITEQRAMQRQLAQAQKMEAVGQLTGGLAHDFNNLLAVVIGNLDLLEGALKANPDAQEIAQTALKASLRGADLTRQLLAFSRRQTLLPKVIDLNETVSGTTDLLRRTLGEAIEVKLKLADGLWPALADLSQVESALVNFAVNARDAMERGGILTVETANKHLDEHYAAENAEVAPGDYAMLAVTDTGAGIPPDVLGRVFEPFFTTKGVGKGTGLGLSMVYGFAKQSGGHVKIYSELGHGTTVRLYLPRAKDVVAAAKPAVTGAVATPLSAMILVVEDNPDVRKVVVKQLLELGHRVEQADNAAAALAILEKGGPIDLLFTDVVMPGGMTGTSLAHEARKLRPGIRVLLTSGFAEAAMQNHAHFHEGMELLSKPYRKAELARKILDVLGRG